MLAEDFDEMKSNASICACEKSITYEIHEDRDLWGPPTDDQSTSSDHDG